MFKLTRKGKESVLHAFVGGDDGASPRAGLIADSNNNLYGTTWVGGADFGGTVFEVTAAGRETVLYPFTKENDGGQPEAGLVQDDSGNLYGTTFYYGASGNGVVFKLGQTGSEQILHPFSGGNDGAHSYGVLTKDAAGNFYGTTSEDGQYGWGTVFKLTPGGKETVLYEFAGGNDGSTPKDLIIDNRGNLYGVTHGGGPNGAGTVFEVTP